VSRISHATTRYHVPAAAVSALILALAFGARRTVGRIEGAGFLALYVIFVVVAITASF